MRGHRLAIAAVGAVAAAGAVGVAVAPADHGHGRGASLRNVKGERGQPLVYLSQDFFLAASPENHHTQVAAGPPPGTAACRPASRARPAATW